VGGHTGAERNEAGPQKAKEINSPVLSWVSSNLVVILVSKGPGNQRTKGVWEGAVDNLTGR